MHEGNFGGGKIQPTMEARVVESFRRVRGYASAEEA
jgi:hypothetical protein